jgi:8-oxo-dGTP diphosphatase
MSEHFTTGTRRRVVVDVYLLLARDGRLLLSQRANTGYGDGAYEPPSGQLAERETIVETAIRIAAGHGISVAAEQVSLAHVMHDVSGGGRIAFFLDACAWNGEPTADLCWFPVGELPTNMLDRARVALRDYSDGMRFSTYPAFAPPANLASLAPCQRAPVCRNGRRGLQRVQDRQALADQARHDLVHAVGAVHDRQLGVR